MRTRILARKLAPVLGAAGLFLSAAAPALALDVHLLGGFDATHTSTGGFGVNGQPNLLQETPEYGLAGGGALVVPLGHFTGLEFDLLYLERKFNLNFGNGNVQLEQTQHLVEVPILFRVYPSPLFSLGLGPYFGKYLGQISQTTRTGASTATGTQSYASANQTSADIGFAFALGMDFPVTNNWGFMLEGRYTLGMTNNSTNGNTTLRFNDILIMAGIRFGGL